MSFLYFHYLCKQIQQDPDAGWKAVTDENWTLQVTPYISKHMLYSLPEMIMSALNKTMRAFPSTSAAASLIEFYTYVMSDADLTPRVRRSAIFHELELLLCVRRAWIGRREAHALQQWKKVHYEKGFHNVVWFMELHSQEKEEEEEKKESNDIWTRLPLLSY
jgi:hypothetical protein